jgi:hypothetical protein
LLPEKKKKDGKCHYQDTGYPGKKARRTKSGKVHQALPTAAPFYLHKKMKPMWLHIKISQTSEVNSQVLIIFLNASCMKY